MANIKVTPTTIKQRLQSWAQGAGTADVLIFHSADGLDERDIINMAWQLANMIITITPYNDNFRQIKFIEKL